MDPNQQLPQLRPQDQRIDSSYLDQIAAPMQQKTLNPAILWGLIGGSLLIMGIIIMILLSSGGPSTSERMTAFLYRVQSLKTLVSDSTDTLKSSELRAANSSLSSVLTGIQTETSTLLSGSSEKVASKPPKDSPILSEYEQINTKLEDARLNVAFDRVYAREVVYQIATLRTEMLSIYNDSSSKELHAFLETADKDLKGLSEDIAKFNE